MRWDDPGAPQRSPADAASIVNILKKCLVDGYGDTDPLGWTLEFEDAPGGVAVFRNSPVTGSGGYFRISPYNVPTNAYIRTQSAMAATGSAPADLFAPGYLNSVPTEAALTRWIIVGDERAFYFLLHHSTTDFVSSTMSVAMFIGDFTPVIPTDVATFICTGANANSVTSSLTVNFTSINTGPLSCASGRTNQLINALGGDNSRSRLGIPTGVSGSSSYNPYALYLAGEIGESYLANADNTEFPAGGLIQPVALKRDVSVSQSRMTDVENPFIRGYLPGLIGLGWKTHYGTPWPAFKEIENAQHLGVALNSLSSTYGGVMLWINTEDWG
ncbi:hypothetical protein [Rheinheimera aquimaris]|uniref:hypothetical protein n=1 Tax=Rheinheimera aquimaris TaxID=412437 RepID=UPI003A97672A